MGDIIYCIGDSHVGVFSGTNSIQPRWPERSSDRLTFFRTFRIGPVLAYSLHRDNTTNMAKEKAADILHECVPNDAWILMSFGEIDCREHIRKQSISRKVALVDIISDCVDKYLLAVESLRGGRKVIIYNAIPSRRYTPTDRKPVISRVEKENKIKTRFNRYLAKRASVYGYSFLSIYRDVIDSSGIGKEKYYLKNASKTPHLSKRSLPFILDKTKSIVGM